MSDLPVFRGTYYQKGHGLGGLLGILRTAMPFLKPIMKN